MFQTVCVQCVLPCSRRPYRKGLQDVEVWVCGEGPGGIRRLPSPNGFGKYRDAVALEVGTRS